MAPFFGTSSLSRMRCVHGQALDVGARPEVEERSTGNAQHHVVTTWCTTVRTAQAIPCLQGTATRLADGATIQIYMLIGSICDCKKP